MQKCHARHAWQSLATLLFIFHDDAKPISHIGGSQCIESAIVDDTWYMRPTAISSENRNDNDGLPRWLVTTERSLYAVQSMPNKGHIQRSHGATCAPARKDKRQWRRKSGQMATAGLGLLWFWSWPVDCNILDLAGCFWIFYDFTRHAIADLRD